MDIKSRMPRSRLHGKRCFQAIARTFFSHLAGGGEADLCKHALRCGVVRCGLCQDGTNAVPGERPQAGGTNDLVAYPLPPKGSRMP